MAELVSCADQWGRPIALTDERWNGHILTGHLELDGQHTAVGRTLQRPDVVTHDPLFRNGENSMPSVSSPRRTTTFT